jgi:hypothetical protein
VPEFRLVETDYDTLPPGKCIVCGSQHRPLTDLGADALPSPLSPNGGRLQLCALCSNSVGRTVGMTEATESRVMRAELWEQQRIIDHLHLQRDAFMELIGQVNDRLTTPGAEPLETDMPELPDVPNPHLEPSYIETLEALPVTPGDGLEDFDDDPPEALDQEPELDDAGLELEPVPVRPLEPGEEAPPIVSPAIGEGQHVARAKGHWEWPR